MTGFAKKVGLVHSKFINFKEVMVELYLPPVKSFLIATYVI